MIPPAGECVWGCESGQPFNREHIIGKQFAKAIGMPFPVSVSWGELHRVTSEHLPHGESVEKELGVVLDDRVCERCNKQWMKRLDDRTIKFLRPALDSEASIAIALKQQLDLARWATKVALLLALWFHDQPRVRDGAVVEPNYVPADNFTRLYRDTAGLPKHTHVWIGAVAPWVPVSECMVTSEGIQSQEGKVGYYTTFRLQRMIFFVLGVSTAYAHPLDMWLDAERLVGQPETMTRIWPMLEPVIHWPPPHRLDADALTRLVQPKPDRR